MGLKLKDVVYGIKFEKIGIALGKKISPNVCRVCGKKLNTNEIALGIHTFGEVPTYFHPKCAIILSENIIDTVKNI